MESLSSIVTSRASKCCREDESTSQDKYTFQGKNLKCQTKHFFMNILEYFKKEAKKSKGHLNVLESTVSKAIGKTVYVVKTICELAFSLRYFMRKYQENL